MNGWQRMVREFQSKFGMPVRDKPVTLPWDIGCKRLEMRAGLITEEARETVDASEMNNLEKVADGIGDTIYVCIGLAIELGIDLDPIMTEIHRTNMLKAGGATREDGKILKPEGWQPPRIKEILQAQMDDDVWPKAT